MTLHLNLHADTVDFNGIISDARGKGHWGVGNAEVSLRSMEELQKIKPLLERAYFEN